MPYTTEEGGRLNNFAREPQVYQAEPPTENQKRNYLFLGIGALILIGGLVFVAFSVSNMNIS
ncbi:MAG: ssl1498 family light-harvesting-like protein [Nostocaceae cyanobacterium]|nr:ssl1498 family light-harvesting-like protein [Nostocaceae cyanobacterium]